MARRSARGRTDRRPAGPRTDLTRPHLPALVDLGTTLRALPLGPQPAFRDALRARLITAAATPASTRAPAPPVRPSRPRRRSRRRTVAGVAGTALAALLAGTGTSGVALASSRSLPGDPFYPVKRAAESAQLTAAGSTVARAHRHLQFAAVRLHEIRALAAQEHGLTPTPERARALTAALRDMDRDTVAGVSLLERAYLTDRRSARLSSVRTFLAAQQAGLTAVSGSLPAAARAQAGASLDLLAAAATQSAHLATPPVAVTPGPAPAASPEPTPSAAVPPGSPSPSAGAPAGDGPASPAAVASPQASAGGDPQASPSPADPASGAPPSQSPGPGASAGPGEPGPSPTPAPGPSAANPAAGGTPATGAPAGAAGPTPVAS